MRERRGGVDDDGVFRNVFFRPMQAHSEFAFFWSSAEVSRVPRHSLIDPPVHGVQVDVQHKHAVKQVDEFGKVPRASAEKGDGLLLIGDEGLYFLYIPNLVLGHPGSRGCARVRSRRQTCSWIASKY